MSEKIGVLIVDDSALMRNLISRMVQAAPDLEVAERAMNGVFALQKIPRVDPDVIVLDLEMPVMGGIEFLRERKRLGIAIPVIILSSLARRGAEITMEALSLGAADFVLKPSEGQDAAAVGERLCALIRVYGAQRRRAAGKAPPESSPAFPALTVKKIAASPPAPLRKPGRVEIIAIGVSTGGPDALREVFSHIDGGLAQPVVVVQHMPPGFTGEFARSLDRVCPLELKEAADGDLLEGGRILIAQGDRHLEVERRDLAAVARLSDGPPVSGHRPSADVLFASVARTFRNHALAVIMTGMGRDGAEGLGAVRLEGGLTLGQDEKSSIVYGMPRAAWELGHVCEQVPLDRMAARISALAGGMREA